MTPSAAGGAAGLVAASALASGAALSLFLQAAQARSYELLPAPFANSAPGDAVLFDTDEGPVAFVYIGPSDPADGAAGAADEGAYFVGCPVPSVWPVTPEALRDPATLGEPYVRYWYNADGMIVRSVTAGGAVTTSEPYHCVGSIGVCRSAHRAGSSSGGPGARWETEMSSTFDGEVLRWRERVIGDEPGDDGWIEAEGWWRILPNAWFGDGASATRLPDGSEARSWWRLRAGPAPLAELCAGIS